MYALSLTHAQVRLLTESMEKYAVNEEKWVKYVDESLENVTRQVTERFVALVVDFFLRVRP